MLMYVGGTQEVGVVSDVLRLVTEWGRAKVIGSGDGSDGSNAWSYDGLIDSEVPRLWAQQKVVQVLLRLII